MKSILVLTALVLATAGVCRADGTEDQVSDQVAKQQQLVDETYASVQKAIADKDNTVHISEPLFKATVEAGSAGILYYNFAKGTKLHERVAQLYNDRVPAARPKKVTGVTVAEESALKAETAATVAGDGTRATYFRDVMGYTGRISQAAFIMTLGVWAIGDVVKVKEGADIYFHDTQEIKDLKTKLDVARLHLEEAKADLKSIARAKTLAANQ